MTSFGARHSLTHKRVLALAALTLSGAMLLTSCAADNASQATGTPSPSASVTPPVSSTGEPGPAQPAPVPTTTADISEPVTFGTGITVALTSVTSTTVTAQTPGEVDGTAVVVTVEARNDSTAEQSLDSAVVTVVADDGQYGIGTTAGGGTALSGTIAPGASATGTYVFMLDPTQGRVVTISVNYAAGEPLAEFTGHVS